MNAEFQRVFERLVGCIATLRAEACEDGLIFGLRGVPDHVYCRRGKDPNFRLGCCTNQWEKIITQQIAARLNVKDEPCYPSEAVEKFNELWPGRRGSNNQKGDLLVPVDDSSELFVECKSVFECVLGKPRTGPIEHNGRRYGRDYSANEENIFTDPKHAMTCVSIDEARIDAEKLNRLSEFAPKCHRGLLLLEFDRSGRELCNRADYSDLKKWLCADGWLQVGRQSWDDKVELRAKRGFLEHVVLWVKYGDPAALTPGESSR